MSDSFDGNRSYPTYLGQYEKPYSLHDNNQKDEVVIYGPNGESLVKRVPRKMGFKSPIDYNKKEEI